MTKVLFLIPNLAHGGAEKVLVNLANNMDKTKFDVTVQTLFDVGVNRQYLNSDVKYIGGFKRMPRGNTYVMKLFSPAGDDKIIQLKSIRLVPAVRDNCGRHPDSYRDYRQLII